MKASPGSRHRPSRGLPRLLLSEQKPILALRHERFRIKNGDMELLAGRQDSAEYGNTTFVTWPSNSERLHVHVLIHFDNLWRAPDIWRRV